MAPAHVHHGAPLRTLLYVEDNPANLKVVEQLIARRPDIRLLTAVNGNLGIELARDNQPEVILMDINLPGISGLEALKILREDPTTAHIPIVALSANAMQRDIDKGLQAGFFWYLTKPIKVNEFFFGTDGIRGRTNTAKLTPEVALKAGMAAGRIFTRGDHRHRVVIGKDTRLSGYMIESALVSGFTAVGMDVFQFGPLPTPAVAMLTRSLRADLGVMITASHNPFEDNGIKFFGPDGQKLSDAVEMEIEALMAVGLEQGLAPSARIGRAKRIDDSQARYIEFAKRTFPRNLRLDGLRIVIDCAHGAAYKVAPEVLWELGADIVTMGVTPDGTNINQDCGSTAPQAMCNRVREVRADFGIALDGDADRVVMADEHGRIIDGDQILALIAKSWSKTGELKGGGVVGTVMSNAGLDRYLKTLNLSSWRVRRWATAMCWRKWPRAASMSAANSPAISSCRISPPPATA